jgi:hypothetical protein
MVRTTASKIFFETFKAVTNFVKLGVDDIITFFAKKANLNILDLTFRFYHVSGTTREKIKLPPTFLARLIGKTQPVISLSISTLNLTSLHTLSIFSFLNPIRVAAYNHIRFFRVEIRTMSSHQSRIITPGNHYDVFSKGIDNKGIRLKSKSAGVLPQSC